MTQKSLAESMRCFPLSFRKYLANYIFKKVEKSGNRSNITVISNFLKTKNIAKASNKFWQNIASYIILNEKKAFWGYFADHSLERVPQWVQYSGIDSALFGLKYCNIPPSLQPPALELLWTFTISIFNPLPQQNILIRIAFAILLFATFSQSLNSDEED